MDNHLVVLYGSQTGNAEDLAKRIGRQAKSYGLSVLVETMDDFPLKKLPSQKLVLFVCSTTGHGQEPENMKNFYNFIRRRDLPSQCLSKLSFAVFGMGDSSYERFNYVSKILFKRLKECGATPFLDLALGDEQHRYGCDGGIYPKLIELWDKLGITQPEGDIQQLAQINLYSLKTDRSTEAKNFFKQEYEERYKLRIATCIINKRLTDEKHFQDTRFLAFKTCQTVDYEPGDVCTILPSNLDDNVDTFMKLLNLQPNIRVSIQKQDPNFMVNYLYDFIPDGITLRELVKNYLDIQSIPRRSFFEHLWTLSDNDLERDKLKEFASTEGQEDVYDYCTRPKRSILEVILDFQSVAKNIKPESLLDLIPPIKPRSFSIASSSREHPNEIHLIVGRVEYKTLLKKPRRGLCSNYLANLVPMKDTIRFFIGKTSFKLPKNISTPIIMVGPGLGIAPFRSFIEDRRIQKTTSELNHLYFGCRFKNSDFYFQDELELYSKSNLIRLRVAFSREEPKQYVQDLLKEDSNLIQTLIEQKDAILYVAGNSRLPGDLRSYLSGLLTDHRVNLLESQGRIQYDCW